jgi:predicted nucleic acid-binding protein
VILVDTSVWVDHLRAGDRALAGLLEAAKVLAHPFVIGELALGNLPRRDQALRELQDLPQANVATDREVLYFVDRHRLFGLGVGYVDAHLLASVTPHCGRRFVDARQTPRASRRPLRFGDCASAARRIAPWSLDLD